MPKKKKAYSVNFSCFRFAFPAKSFMDSKNSGTASTSRTTYKPNSMRCTF